MKKSILILALTSILSSSGYAQIIEAEKTYKLDGKAKRGVLKHVENHANGDYELFYLTKAKQNLQ